MTSSPGRNPIVCQPISSPSVQLATPIAYLQPIKSASSTSKVTQGFLHNETPLLANLIKNI